MDDSSRAMEGGVGRGRAWMDVADRAAVFSGDSPRDSRVCSAMDWRARALAAVRFRTASMASAGERG
jgi:hypothetical protein